MRAWLLAAGLLFGNLACAPCRTRSDCDPGFICNFDTGDCEQGCTSNEDCGGTSVCNASTGSCQVLVLPSADAGPADVGTSSTADAGR